MRARAAFQLRSSDTRGASGPTTAARTLITGGHGFDSVRTNNTTKSIIHSCRVEGKYLLSYIK